MKTQLNLTDILLVLLLTAVIVLNILLLWVTRLLTRGVVDISTTTTSTIETSESRILSYEQPKPANVQRYFGEDGIRTIVNKMVKDVSEPQHPLTGQELYKSYVFEICTNYPSVDPYLIISLIKHESNFEPDAKNYNGTCIGLMQISTKWHTSRAKDLGVDLKTPYGNIATGVDLFAELLDTADDDVGYALMLYHRTYNSAKSYHDQGLVDSYAQSVMAYAEELRKEAR